MRQGEKEGQSYHFVSRQTFQEKVAKGEFFEWEEIHGNFYGTLKAPLDEMVRKGSDVIFDIDIRGAQSVRKHFPKHTVVTFIVPPSIGDLEVRIAARGEASSEEISRRLATAREEYEQMMLAYHRADGSEYLIINDQLDLALAAMNAILDAERLRFARFSPELAKRVCGVV
jgi:guanylate kinase